MFKNILLGASVFAALIAILIFSGRLPGASTDPSPTGDVVIWGTVSQDMMDTLLQQYNIQAKTYRVSYRQIKEANFTGTLVDALANGNGPDLILAPYQIILSQTSRLYPFPLASMSEKTYKDLYVDGASILWSPYGALGLPISVEPLVLFYNRTLFSKHGVPNPPTYWDELNTLAPKLTVLDGKGNFLESGIALGTFANIPYVKDILVAIVGQLGQTPVLGQYSQNGIVYQVLINSEAKKDSGVLPLVTAVQFFMQFADQSKATYSWNQFLPQAQEAFIAEKLAMYIGYSGEYSSIQASNQKLDIGMTYLPQTKGYNTFVTGMRMYGLATLRQTKNPQAALTAEATLSGQGWSPALSSGIGGISPLRSVVTSQVNAEVVSRSTLVARGWYDIYFDKTNDFFERMIEDILSGRALINDSVDVFVGRFTNLYTGVK